MVNQLIPPFAEDADGPVSARWEKWREHFEAYLAWKDVDNQEEKFKSLMMFGGPDIRKVVKQVHVDESHAMENRYHIAMSMLDDYFVPRLSKTFERQKFREMKPAVGEKFDTFVIRLKKQAAYCDFGDQLESMVADQIITTTTDVSLKRKCLEKDFNFKEIVAIGRTHESVQIQMSDLDNRNGNLQKVSAVETEANEESILKVRSKLGGPRRFRCFRCNGRHDSKDPSCPAKSLECRSCGQVGHFSRCCFLKRKKTNGQPSQYNRFGASRKQKRFVREVSVDGTERNSDVVDLFHLGAGKKLVPVSVGGVCLKFVIDTGADEDVLSEADWATLKRVGFEAYSIRRGSSKVFNAYGINTPLKVLGEVDAEAMIDGRSTDTTFYVIQNGKCSLLSGETAVKLGLVKFLQAVNDESFPHMDGKQ
ncbi:uncharacterized protein LOC135697317 [Ochlerotatus camptorhynchus]|uniref:uncharacterized protein LOC135697317 n=1 Tax=Ochlerotatus camptorhynchus TaxID=644619 RepID=UPI0031D85A60